LGWYIASPLNCRATIWIVTGNPLGVGTGVGSGLKRQIMVSVVPTSDTALPVMVTRGRGTPVKVTECPSGLVGSVRPTCRRSSWLPPVVWRRSNPANCSWPAHWAAANPEQPSHNAANATNHVLRFIVHSPLDAQRVFATLGGTIEPR